LSTTSHCLSHLASNEELEPFFFFVDQAKKAALEGVLQQIERSYGRGSIVKLGDADHMSVACISSGALTLGKFCEGQ
jgi:hypothetical protein